MKNEKVNKEWKDVKEKVLYIVSTMDIMEGDTEFSYFNELMEYIFVNDPDFPVIKEKMDNLVSLCYEKNKDPEEFRKFLDLDFEDEIWYMI